MSLQIGKRVHALLGRVSGGMIPLVLHRTGVDHIVQQAAALAFESALGLVPLFAVAFALLKATGALDARSALLEFIAGQVFPSSGNEVMTYLVGFADKVDIRALGAGGLCATLLVVYWLLHSIEDVWNQIWRVPRQRSIMSKFLVFYTLATLIPFLMALSLYHTTRFWRAPGLTILVPLSSTWLALLLANKLVPFTRVSWRAAAAGSLLSALLFELAKLGFGLYLTKVALSKYHNVYGTLGLAPLLLLWVYLAWATVLIGAELAHALERREVLEAEQAFDADGQWFLPSGEQAARLLVEVARRFRSGGAPLTAEDLAQRLALPRGAVLRLLRRLDARGLLLPVESRADPAASPAYVLIQPAEQIRLDQILAASDPQPVEETPGALAEALGRLGEARRQVAAQTSLGDLL